MFEGIRIRREYMSSSLVAIKKDVIKIERTNDEFRWLVWLAGRFPRAPRR